MSNLNVNDIAQQITDGLSAVCDKLLGEKKYGSKAWTKAILEMLAELGSGYDCEVMPIRKEGVPEWLYDMIWYTSSENNTDKSLPHVRDVILVAESEWLQNLADIKWDFDKLLIARSRIKLLIAEDLCGQTEKLAREAIDAYGAEKQKGELYILALYSDKKFRFEKIQV